MTRTTVKFLIPFFALFFMLQRGELFGQSWNESIEYYDTPPNMQVPNQIMLLYSENANDTEIEDIRDAYGIVDIDEVHPIGANVYNAIHLNGRTIDVWTIYQWPIILLDETQSIDNMTELEGYLDINPDGTGDRSEINSFSLNYYTSLNPVSVDVNRGFNANPVPDCNEMDRVVGPSSDRNVGLEIIIFDQLVHDLSYFPEISSDRVIPINSNLGGRHGTKVASIIKHTLDEAGVTDYKLTSLGVFDRNGQASYEAIFEAFEALEERNIQDAIINMSASLVINNEEDAMFQEAIWEIIGDYLENSNILLISSGSNSAYTNYYGSYNTNGSSPKGGVFDGPEMYYHIGYGPQPDLSGNTARQFIYPGHSNLNNEITVAGLDDCFSSIALFSGGDPNHCEIGAQASQVLYWNGDNYQTGDGVSYAVPLVTAAAVQLVESGVFSPSQIKDDLLNFASNRFHLEPYIEQGRILNVTASLNQTQNLQGSRGGSQTNYEEIYQRKTAEQSIKTGKPIVSPNPFHDYLNIHLNNLPSQGTVSLQLFDLTGRLVEQKEVLEVGTTIDWGVSVSLPKGSYWMKVQMDEEVWSQKIIKF